MIQDTNGVERMLEDVEDECAGESRPACERCSDGLRIREVSADVNMALDVGANVRDASVLDERAGAVLGDAGTEFKKWTLEEAALEQRLKILAVGFDHGSESRYTSAAGAMARASTP